MRLLLSLLLLLSPLIAQESAPPASEEESAPAAAVSEPEPAQPVAAEPDHQEWIQKEVGLEQMFHNPPERFASLLFNRIDTVKVNGVEKVRYSISSAGLEPGKRYLFMAWELGTDAPHLLLPSVQVNAKGVLQCDPGNRECPGGPGSEVNVAVSNRPGQPSRFVIADEEEKPIAIGEVIPNPSTVTDHECTLETILLLPDATIALVTGRGFDAGEDVKVISTSFDEHFANAGKATEEGTYQTVLLPIAKDHDSGDTMVTMNSSKCELSTQFAWGVSKPVAEPAVGDDTTKAAPSEPAAPASETVIAPIRTATDQIQRAIAKQAASGETSKQQPQLHAGPKPPPEQGNPDAAPPAPEPAPEPQAEEPAPKLDSDAKQAEPSSPETPAPAETAPQPADKSSDEAPAKHNEPPPDAGAAPPPDAPVPGATPAPAPPAKPDSPEQTPQA